MKRIAATLEGPKANNYLLIFFFSSFLPFYAEYHFSIVKSIFFSPALKLPHTLQIGSIVLNIFSRDIYNKIIFISRR